MIVLALVSVAAMGLLVASTDQFVTGASRVAEGLRVSSVLVGALILGCGTGLPELALAFHRSTVNPLRETLGLTSGGSGSLALVCIVALLAVVLSIPTLLPRMIPRHSPLILAATIAFASLLRGSLDLFEGAAMLVGFACGIAWIVYADREADFDPFAPVIEDDYERHGAYIEAPVMTPLQVEFTRCLLGLLGTAIGAQVLAFSLQEIFKSLGTSEAFYGLVFIAVGSVLPHVVVAVQALKQHHKALAVGNLIGSNLFQSLAVGGLVAVIRPYQLGGHFGLKSLGIVLATATLTGMLLHTEKDLSKRQGFGLLGAYSLLVVLSVP